MRTIRFALAAAVVGLSACGSSSHSDASLSFPETAMMTVTGSENHLNVAIRSSPQPPVLGLTNFELTVTDSEGNPVSGLQLSVVPWMPQMGHGTSITPTVKEVNPGIYQVTQVYLFMPGEWALRTSFSGSVSDSIAPDFNIP
jgi:hypothetical protein